MKIWVREKNGCGWRGIWRASVPAAAAFVGLPSPKRQSRPRLAQLRGRRFRPAALIMNCLFCFILFAQASALPVHIGLLLLPADAKPMTHGCEKGSCCTPFCYLDKHGVHHCVHSPGDSCECGISTGDFDTNPVFLSAIIIFPFLDNLLPTVVATLWRAPAHLLFAGREPATPTPPPK